MTSPILDGQHTIAIIGVGAKMPGALSAPDFWENIKNGHYAIQDVPVDRWDPSLYWDPDPLAIDKTYSKIGGWVTGFEFNRKQFRLPPTVVKSTDPTQLLTLAAVRDAIEDAGYLERDFDRDRCAVILGNALGGDLRDETNLRVQYAEINAALRNSMLEASLGDLSAAQIDALLEKVEKTVKSKIVGISEDSMPGELANIIAGRVAQLFDLRGPNYVCDAACASTLAALESAVFGLRAGQFDMVVTGGADQSMGAPTFVKFSKIGALSPDGSRPFDQGANGFVMGEGAGILILKRLGDAIRDGDNVYAVIRGIGGSSDGKGKGITAPNPRGQEHALRRAYHDAGIGPSAVSLMEAHGTSTPVGDPAEVASLRKVFSEDNNVKAGSVGLGSVKSMIGHLKSAAAAASLVKIAFALRDQTLPPTINVKNINPALELEGSPFVLQTETAEWKSDKPRVAGISAFGFGGTNFHVVLEEFNAGTGKTKIFTTNQSATSANKTGHAMDAKTTEEATEGILGFSGDSLTAVKTAFEAARTNGVFSDHLIAFEDTNLAGSVRLAIVFTSIEEREIRVEKAAKALATGKGWKVLRNQGVFLSEGAVDGGIAMLFPGQGSQYLGMLDDLKTRFPVVQETFDEADDIMRPLLDDRNISEIISPASGVDESDAFLELTKTEVTQPAVLTVDAALFRLFKQLGITPDTVAGHSLGEYGACIAAGVMDFSSAVRTVAQRGTEMASATPMNGDPGLMAGIPMDAVAVQAVLDEVDGYVVCANKNCPNQTIIAGETKAVEAAIEILKERDVKSMILPVSHAFHSKVVAAASVPLRKHLDTIDISSPHTPILTNVTGDFYPEEADAIRDLLSEQVAAPVEFIAMVENMYARGIRTFVEVGPKRAQTSFVSDILSNREHTALYSNHPKSGDVGSFFNALAELWTIGAWQKATAIAATTTQANGSVDREEVLKSIIAVLCEKTGYDIDEIEPGFELEADLGVDTVKQAEVMAAVREQYALAKDDDFRLSEFPTLNHLADYVVSKSAGTLSVVSSTAASRATTVPSGGRDAVLTNIIAVLCDKTGYDVDEIEPDFELEADLGIDTVKQAEIMATVREQYALAKDDGFRLSEYPTLNHLADYVITRADGLEIATDDAIEEKPLAVKPVSSQSIDRSVVLQEIVAVLCEKTGYDMDEIEADFELEADLGIDTVKQAEIMATVRERYALAKDDEFRLSEYPTLNHLADYVVDRSDGVVATQVVQAPETDKTGSKSAAPNRDLVLQNIIAVLCEKTGYDHDEIEPSFELEADLGIDTVKQAEIMATVREQYALAKDDDFRLSEYPTLNHLTDYVVQRADNVETKTKPVVRKPPAPRQRPVTKDEHSPHAVPAEVVISGCALGLPGLDEVFSEQAIDQLLGGQNMIRSVSEENKHKMAQKKIVRLVKQKDGGGELIEVDSPDDVIQLAGTPGAFDLNDWGIDERFTEGLDETSQLAIAAGLNALRDAGLPLIPKYRETKNGKKITVGLTLPKEIGDRTGVIFATAFAGQDALLEEVEASQSEDYVFNHRLLLRMLGIANSRFAEFVGARGPNTKINNACASMTTAVSIAEDWIRLGRCDRVVVLSADNASGDRLLEWIGSGFIAAGAATTETNVEDAALPFDKRRNGIIIGMGAAAMVVERAGLPESRGIEPIADLLATRFVNSALHPTRLDPSHIANEVGLLLDSAESTFDIDREKIAKNTVFVSHETYSPARGGSAQTEIASLRENFGSHADEVVIANTKGFTGHAMGAGIEDILALKALQRRELPHIANFKEPDPELGDLRLSEGGEYPLDYALRLAAGFGSQLALALYRFRARKEDRIFDEPRYQSWLKEVSHFAAPSLEVEHKKLVLRDDPSKSVQPPKIETPRTVENPKTIELHVGNDPTEITPRYVAAEAHASATFDLSTLRTSLKNKRILIIAGPIVVADLLSESAKRCGADVLVVRDDAHRSPLDAETCWVLSDEDTIVQEMKTFGRVDGIINLLGFGDASTAARIYDAAFKTFNIARAWRRHLDRDPDAAQFFTSVTGMGGRLGFDRADGPLAAAGAVCGFTKALKREWSDANVCAIDIPRDGLYPNLGLQILWQAVIENEHAEVGLIGGVKYLPTFIEMDEVKPTTKNIPVSKDDVLLITGGARGISAEIALDLAGRYNCKLALVGRTALSIENPLALNLDDEKKRVKSELKSGGGKVTPLAVQNALRPLIAQQDIARNMSRMTEAGATVSYYSCDVSSEESVHALVESVQAELGQITGVIHGAGVEESRPLMDKDKAAFDRVFVGKALGGKYLVDATEGSAPKFFVFFTSVAGRFGNPGQVDYSAANESLNKLAASINASGNSRAISIDWTAWDEVGMAAESGMRTLLLSRGVELLPPAIGTPMVGDILEAGVVGEFLVAGALGDFAPDDVAPRTLAPTRPFVTRIMEQTSSRVTVARTFDIDADRFLRDHVYEGNPVVPGVMGLEFMSETAAVLLESSELIATDVLFDRAIKLHRNEPIELTATAVKDGDVVKAEVLSTRTSKTGRVMTTVHFSGTFSVGAAVAKTPFVIPNANFEEGPDRIEIYRRYFHTGVFQVLDSVPIVGDDHVIASGRIPLEHYTSGFENTAFETDPMIREMAFQAIGLWGMSREGFSYLPRSIAAARTFARTAPGESVSIRCERRKKHEEHTIAFDVEVRRLNGELLQQLENVVLIAHRRLLDDERFERFSDAQMLIRQTSAPEADAIMSDLGVDLDQLLTQEERAAYERLISLKRRREWIAARVAAKQLAVDFIRDFLGRESKITDIVIDKRERGAPVIRMRDRSVKIDFPEISITHSDNVAIAAFAIGAMRIGIDLEQVEERESSFAANYFTNAELALDGFSDNDEKLSTLWSAKEAVSKALGLGLYLKTEEVEIERVQKVESNRYILSVRFTGEAASEGEKFGVERCEVTATIEGKRVFTFVRLEQTGQVQPVQEHPDASTSLSEVSVVSGDLSAEERIAIIALLKHKGVLPKGSPDTKANRNDLPNWKA